MFLVFNYSKELYNDYLKNHNEEASFTKNNVDIAKDFSINNKAKKDINRQVIMGQQDKSQCKELYV